MSNSVPSPVLFKLVLFSLMMAVVPIGTYFGTLKYVWDGSPTYAAISAVVAANIVLVGYVVVAFREDAAQDALDKEGRTLPPKKIQ